MYFDDGSNPSNEIIRAFISKADSVISSGGKIAVHCKAGLGRTGVLIGAYLIWKFNFTSNEVIGFMRFMRPGCVVGPQQHFMYQNFMDWIRWNQEDKVRSEMKKELEKEKLELKRKILKEMAEEKVRLRDPSEKGEALSSNIRRSQKSNLKRPSGSDEEEKKKGKGKSKDDEDDDDDEIDGEGEDDNGPSTPPPPKRMAYTSTPMTSVPTHKPTPCVGQPRKSPSPERKRPAGSNRPPSTIARMQYHTSTEGFGRALSGSFSNDMNDETRGDENGGERDGLTSSSIGIESSSESKVLSSSKTNVLINKVSAISNVDPINKLKSKTSSSEVSTSSPSPLGHTSRVRGLGHERTRSEVIPVNHLIKKDDVFDSDTTARAILPPLRASPDIKNKYGLKDTSTSNNNSNHGTPLAGLKGTESNSLNSMNSITSNEKLAEESKSKNNGSRIDKDAEALGIVEYSSDNKDGDTSFDSTNSEEKVKGLISEKNSQEDDDSQGKEETLIASPVKSSVSTTRRLPSTTTSSSSNVQRSKLNSSQSSSRSSSNSSSTSGKRSTSNPSRTISSRPTTSTTTSSNLIKRRPVPSTATISSTATSSRPKTSEKDSNSLLRDARAGLTKASTSNSRIRATETSSNRDRVGIPPPSSSTRPKSSVGLAASARARPNLNQSGLNSISESGVASVRPNSPSRGVGRGDGSSSTGSKGPSNPIPSERINLKRSRIETPEMKNNGFESNISRFNSTGGTRTSTIPPASMGMGLNRINGLNNGQPHIGRNVRRRRSSAGDVDVPV